MNNTPIKLTQAERRVLSYINGWNAQGTATDIAMQALPAYSKRSLHTHVYATIDLAARGLIKRCDANFHSLEATCIECEPLTTNN